LIQETRNENELDLCFPVGKRGSRYASKMLPATPQGNEKTEPDPVKEGHQYEDDEKQTREEKVMKPPRQGWKDAYQTRRVRQTLVQQ
jgi:hypothetical protein